MTDILKLAEIRKRCATGEAAQTRIEARLTRGDLAREIGISRSALRRWELGERLPTGDAAIRYLDTIEDLRCLTSK